MYRNVASQKLVVFAFDATTNLPKTGDAANITAYVSKDYGTVTVLGDTTATEMDATNAKGYYLFDLTQAETDAVCLTFSAKSSTASIVVIGAPSVVFTDPASYTAGQLALEATLATKMNTFTLPTNFASLSIDAGGSVKVQHWAKKNTAAAKFAFLMTDATTHAPVTGKTVTVTREIDGGAFAAGTLSAVTEIANGWYYCDFAAADMNGNVIGFRATASGCDDTNERIITFP